MKALVAATITTLALSAKVTSNFLLLIFAVIASMGFINQASAETLNSVSHIHHVKVIEKKVLVLTHEGLFELVSKNDMKLVGKDRIDVMAASLTAASGRAKKSESTFLFTPEPYFNYGFRESLKNCRV
jgi:cystathionine beta-lyase family protein involved in aluminum resistance